MYGVIWNILEAHRRSYVILCHTRMVWSIHHVRGMWTTVERSRTFWMVVQGKEKWKKVNKVQHLSECGHDSLGAATLASWALRILVIAVRILLHINS